jgi:ABC-2 type transport system permease protein
MAGIENLSESTPASDISSRRHFATIAWLRWRIFVNGMRGKGAAGELVVKFMSYPFLAIMILGPSIGAGFASYYLVDKDEVDLLAIPLWVIFALWQFIGMNTSATGPSFDLSSLIRFPIRYRDYLLVRLSFGLMDPPTLAGIACLIAMSVGIAFAAPGLFPWAALALILYALCNILFSRMIYSWLERWLAQRRTRELVTGIILALSLGIQFLAQFAQRFSRHGHHAPPNPLLLKITHILFAINWLLPPGLTASSIDHIHRGLPLIAAATLCGVLAYSTAFLIILHLRLYAQFRGEDLSEAPAATPRSASIKTQPAALRAARSTSASFAFLPATVAACLIKEIRYLLRSGPKLYVLVMPVFVVFLFSVRTSGMNYAGVTHSGFTGMLFCYGCAYTQLIFVGMIYNSLGADGAGVQFYFIAPVRMRDVMLAKNLLTCGIFAVEAFLIYIASAFIAQPTPLDLTAATVAWSIFALFLNMSIGNVRSIVSPKVLDPAKVRSQNVSGLNSLISLVVVIVAVALGAIMAIVCRYFHTTYWIAAAVFLILAAFSLAAYTLTLQRLDAITANNLESLNATLSKV